MVAVRDPAGAVEMLEARGEDDAGEADLIRGWSRTIARADPDVIENHNLHGFDLPFLRRRARDASASRLASAGSGRPGCGERAAMRGVARDGRGRRRVRFVAPGRELIDTLDAVLPPRLLRPATCRGTASRRWRATSVSPATIAR